MTTHHPIINIGNNIATPHMYPSIEDTLQKTAPH